MILDIIAFKDKAIRSFSNPIYTQDKLENLETGFARSLHANKALIAKYKKQALYHFGTFDDEKGIYSLLPSPELLFDCDDVIASLPSEEVDNG